LDHVNGTSGDPRSDRYKWIALSNTTLSMTMATIDASIVIIAMPAIFRGIGLNPLTPGNVTYLLWMIMGYLLVQSVLVVTLGRLGDMFGRVKIYNLGFVVFTLASIALSLDPLTGTHGALWLIGFRFVQAFGGAMLMANSAAILTDAFPANKRGMALGINQIAGISGQFVGLLLGGVLAAVNWRLVFWVNVPIGVFGTVWAYRSLHEIATTRRAKIDWIGNILFAVGLGTLLIAITFGIRPYGGHPTGWTNPLIVGGLIGGVVMLIAFCIFETKIAEPMFQMGLFKIRAFAAGNAASLLGSIARGGLQFILVIWLAGIWLPLHGYDFTVTPLWAGIYMLPLTAGFLIAGPISGTLSDRYGPRLFATSGLLLAAICFVGLMMLPVDFPYPLFALLIFGNGIGSGLFASPNTSAIMSSVPAGQRGRHAVHLPELRHVPVHRHLLLADDRRGGPGPPPHPDQRAARPGRTAVGGHAGRSPAAGQHVVLRPARLQPGAEPAGAFRRPGQAPRAQCRGPDRQAVFPGADLGAVPSGPGHRVHRRRDHVGARRAGLAAARQAVLLR
jgi:MFS family permease